MGEKKKGALGGLAAAVILCAFAVNFAANYPQYQLSPIAPALMEQFQMSTVQFSSLFTSSMIPGILLGILAGVICDKYGAKNTVGVTMVITVLALIARIFASDFTMLFVCTILSGVANTFLNSNLAKIMGNTLPPEKVGTGIGIVLAGATVSMAVGMGTTAMLPGYRTAFVLAAAAAAAALILWMAVMGKAQKKTGENNRPAPVPVTQSLKMVIRNRHIWIDGIAVGLVLVGSMCLSTFLPTALQSVRGMDAVAAGAMSSVVTFGNIAGAILGPVICMKIGRMKPYVILFSLLAALGVIFAWQLPVGILMAAALFLTGFLLSGLISQMVALPVMLPDLDPSCTGAAGGMVGTLELLGGVVLTSYVLTPIIGDNYRLFFAVGGILVAAAAVLTLFLPELLGKRK